jgi:TerC family integral membrane protein
VQLDLDKKQPNFSALAAWVGSAVAFGLGIWYFMGQEKAEEYFAGYLLEQSLSVDNLFVFLLVFGFFKTPEASQGKVLQYGILTAAVLRAVFILGGVELIATFEPALGLFAGILIFSSFKLLTKSDDDDDEEDLSNNKLVQLCKRFIKSSDNYDGDKFFTVLKDGTKVCTLARAHARTHTHTHTLTHTHTITITITTHKRFLEIGHKNDQSKA